MFQRDLTAPTFSQIFNEYIASKTLKPRTIRAYTSCARNLKDWHSLPVTSITKQMVFTKHRELSSKHPNTANLTFRMLKCMLDFASIQYESADGVPLIPINPVSRLTTMRAWNKTQPSGDRVQMHDLRAWWAAVENLDHPVHSDYFKLIVLSGLRKGEACNLVWDCVDLEHGYITARNTKNGTDHTLPVGTYLLGILKQRKERADCPWVFPQVHGVGPLVDPKESMQKVTWESGVSFKLHSLRRTFTDLAIDCKLPDYMIKALLNHALSGVTEVHYQGKQPPAKMKEPIQQIEDRLLAIVQPPTKQRIKMSLEVARTGLILPAVP